MAAREAYRVGGVRAMSARRRQSSADCARGVARRSRDARLRSRALIIALVPLDVLELERLDLHAIPPLAAGRRQADLERGAPARGHRAGDEGAAAAHHVAALVQALGEDRHPLRRRIGGVAHFAEDEDARASGLLGGDATRSGPRRTGA